MRTVKILSIVGAAAVAVLAALYFVFHVTAVCGRIYPFTLVG